MATPTAHNTAKPGEIAKTVLLPGDPLRSKYIAEKFLTNPVLVNNVRGVQGYTGTWKNVPVTVMASGMGIPSIGLYSWELYTEYNVQNIIRTGSAGAIQDNLHLQDVVLAMGACTDSNYGHQFGCQGKFAPIADYTLLSTAVEEAKKMGVTYHVGNIFSSDNFYAADVDSNDPWKRMGVLATEMEAAGLYMNAARLGKRALAICAISDHLYLPEYLEPAERETGLNNMITLALNTAAAMGDID